MSAYCPLGFGPFGSVDVDSVVTEQRCQTFLLAGMSADSTQRDGASLACICGVFAASVSLSLSLLLRRAL